MTKTIPGLLRDAARRLGDTPALVSQVDGAISFRELDRQADLVAKALLADGAKPGDRTAIWAPNMWEWVAAAVGIQRVEGVMVPLNTRLKELREAGLVTHGNDGYVVTLVGADLLKRLHELPAFAAKWVALQTKKK